MPLFSPVSAGVSGITATGGTITEVGLYKIHTFTANGTFQVTANPQNQIIEFLVVGGGGGGGYGASRNGGTGGGSGGIYQGSMIPTVTSYSVVVGAGGATAPVFTDANPGTQSSFDSFIAFGGAAGASVAGLGSGPNGGIPVWAPVSSSLTIGRTGGSAGVNDARRNGLGAVTSDISGTSTTYGGGGGVGEQYSGSTQGVAHAAGTGSGKGGNGGSGGNSPGANGGAYGGGGGGGTYNGTGGVGAACSAGGAGVVIVRYRK